MKNLLDKQNARKLAGPNGVSNFILKKVMDQRADNIQKLAESSLGKGKEPLDWNCANKMPIYKG